MRRMDRIALTLGLLVPAAHAGAAAAATPADTMEAFAKRVESRRPALIELRHDLHRHPEVSGQEERTAGLVAGRLRELGFEVEAGVGGHGVVGVLRGGRPGPLVAYRADMDAVPSDAPDPVDYRSLTPGVRHICGHDVHTTIAVAMAEGFAAIADRLPGTVMFVFQPAEERATGAKAMLADGVFESRKPDAIFAVHTAPLDVGGFVTSPGVMMAGRDGVRVTIERADDPPAMANAVRDRLLSFSTLTEQQAVAPAPNDFVFVQAVVRAPANTADTHVVEASIAMASPEVRKRTRAAIEAAIAEMRNSSTSLALAYEERNVAGVDNDAALVESATASIEKVLGAGSVAPLPALVPGFSEDFGSFQDVVPGAFFFIGVSNPEKGIVGMPHSPDYAADDEAIFVGARSMGAVLLDFLASRSGG